MVLPSQAGGTVQLTDPLAKHVDWNASVPARGSRAIGLITLSRTPAACRGRSSARRAHPKNSMRTLTKEGLIVNLQQGRLLFDRDES